MSSLRSSTRGNTSVAAPQVLPLKVIARPPRSTAMHHVVVGHETSVGCPRSGIAVTGALQTGAGAAATDASRCPDPAAGPYPAAGTDPLAGPAVEKASATSVDAARIRPNPRLARTVMTPLSLARGPRRRPAAEC
ncbi:hypothetical protein GCM10027053_00750 [Intrasporangium mesophilum]